MLILGVCLLGVLFALPNTFAPATLEHWPSFLPKHQVALGLDLRGGSHLLLEVDMTTVEQERLNSLVDEVRTHSSRGARSATPILTSRATMSASRCATPTA